MGKSKDKRLTKEPRVIGLVNPAYFCFLNSVIQVLFGIKELRAYFYKREFKNITY